MEIRDVYVYTPDKYLDSLFGGSPYIVIKIRDIVIGRKDFVSNIDQLKIDDFLKMSGL